MFHTDPFALIVLFIALSLLPFAAMVATSYLKIVVVMSLIRNALGIQSIPPNMVINALAMILTFYIMAPVASEAWSIAKEEHAKTAVVQPTATSAGASPTIRTPKICAFRIFGMSASWHSRASTKRLMPKFLK